MAENIISILNKESNQEIDSFVDLSEKRFVLYFNNIYSQSPSKERLEDWNALVGLIKLALLKDIDFNWHKDYEFPSGNIGSLAVLIEDYEGAWQLLNNCGLVDPITKNKF